MSVASVKAAIERVQTRLRDYPATPENYRYMYNESATRRLLIDPVIESLSWDLHDFDHVGIEWRMRTEGANRNVDYVLFNARVIELSSSKQKACANL